MNDPFATPFWEGLNEDKLRITYCKSCSEYVFPPTPVCSRCDGADIEWRDVSGKGAIYSFTNQHQTAPEFPDSLVLALIELFEGPRLLATVDADYDSVDIGKQVQLHPVEYSHEFDRGAFDNYPFFEAVLLDA